MSIRQRACGAVFLLVLAGCSSAADEGGQSGTDSEGGYSCTYQFEEPGGTSVPLDQKWDQYLSPAEYYARLEGSYTFLCRGVNYRVSITSGSAARNVLGVLNDGPTDELCSGLQLDANVHIEADDQGPVHDSSFVTYGVGYTVGGQADQRWFVLMTDVTGDRHGMIRSMRVTAPDSEMRCELVQPDNGEGGSGGQSD